MKPASARLEGAAREALRARLLGLGFDEVRFAAVGGPAGGSLRGWLEAGHQADMHWLERSAAKRMDAGLVVPGARTVIILGVNYGGFAPRGGASHPRWARYALHEDYHDTIKPALAAAGRVLEELAGAAPEDYRYYTDTGPVLERGWAARSGLGFLGKSGMLISRRHGNWLLLGSIVTRVEIEPDPPLRRRAPATGGREEPSGALCGKCTRCLTACPTQAFPRPGVLDARRCISYQTIENKGAIPRELRAAIGPRVYGCDVCLEVCPWNRFARAGRSTLLVAREELAGLTLADLLALTPEAFARVFRRTPMKRTKLTGLLRNACIAAGNSGDRSLLPALAGLARHESSLVRAHAVWAVRRLAGAGAAGWLEAARAAETDAGVLEEYAADVPALPA
ncbi:MAG TPA: tRNA epoxyqueuosine(34) reductase QueG [Opitutaceae bacterium]|nr:tRNA epoxyqueuosine(34) reductase QueG [Opitutaceae bacterium]